MPRAAVVRAAQVVRRLTREHDRWPSFEDAMRSVEAGVFDDREFDVLLGDDEERASSGAATRRTRSGGAPAPAQPDCRAGRAAG